ncbi:hypothetical protein MTO96_048844 [Rhipicephalus appendiculatus]
MWVTGPSLPSRAGGVSRDFRRCGWMVVVPVRFRRLRRDRRRGRPVSARRNPLPSPALATLDLCRRRASTAAAAKAAGALKRS